MDPLLQLNQLLLPDSHTVGRSTNSAIIMSSLHLSATKADGSTNACRPFPEPSVACRPCDCCHYQGGSHSPGRFQTMPQLAACAFQLGASMLEACSRQFRLTKQSVIPLQSLCWRCVRWCSIGKVNSEICNPSTSCGSSRLFAFWRRFLCAPSSVDKSPCFVIIVDVL